MFHEPLSVSLSDRFFSLRNNWDLLQCLTCGSCWRLSPNSVSQEPWSNHRCRIYSPNLELRTLIPQVPLKSLMPLWWFAVDLEIFQSFLQIILHLMRIIISSCHNKGTPNSQSQWQPNIIKIYFSFAQRLIWVRISPPSWSKVIWITWPPRQLSPKLQFVTIYNEMTTKDIYQLWHEATSVTNEAYAILVPQPRERIE